MTCGQQTMIGFNYITIGRLHCGESITINMQLHYFAIEMYFAAMCFNRFTYGRDDMRQFIGTNMRMRFV